MLWARAAGQCAICKSQLVVSSDIDTSTLVVVGEEAHIVSARRNGPRGGEPCPTSHDEYDNLILLCQDDHTKVDFDENVWTSDRLREAKAVHEAGIALLWVPFDQLHVRPSEGDDPQTPYDLAIRGSHLWGIIEGASTLHVVPRAFADGDIWTSHHDRFMEEVSRWLRLDSREIGPRRNAEAIESLDATLAHLADFDFIVLARRRMVTIEGGPGAYVNSTTVEVLILTESELLDGTEESN